MDVSFKACVKLHKVGAISDHLLPCKDEIALDSEVIFQEMREKRIDCNRWDQEGESKAAFYSLETFPRPFKMNSEHDHDEGRVGYFTYRITIKHSADHPIHLEPIMILSEKEINYREDWILDYSVKESFTVSIDAIGEDHLSSSQRTLGLRFTHLLISTMETTWRLHEVLDDFPLLNLPYLLMPLNDKGLVDWELVEKSLNPIIMDAWSEVKDMPQPERDHYLKRRVLTRSFGRNNDPKERFFLFDDWTSMYLHEEMELHFQEWTWRRTYVDYFSRYKPKRFDGDQKFFRARDQDKVPRPLSCAEISSQKSKASVSRVEKKKKPSDDHEWNPSRCFQKLSTYLFLETFHIHPLPLSFFNSMSVICVYMEHLDDCVIARKFMDVFDIPEQVSVNVMIEALSTSDHNPQCNYERLENLGDIVIKWASLPCASA